MTLTALLFHRKLPVVLESSRHFSREVFKDAILHQDSTMCCLQEQDSRIFRFYTVDILLIIRLHIVSKERIVPLG